MKHRQIQPAIVPVDPARGEVRLDRDLAPRTFRFRRASRRTFGRYKTSGSRRTFGFRGPSRRTFGGRFPSRRTFGFRGI